MQHTNLVQYLLTRVYSGTSLACVQIIASCCAHSQPMILHKLRLRQYQSFIYKNNGQYLVWPGLLHHGEGSGLGVGQHILDPSLHPVHLIPAVHAAQPVPGVIGL